MKKTNFLTELERQELKAQHRKEKNRRIYVSIVKKFSLFKPKILEILLFQIVGTGSKIVDLSF
ncbi:MAG: hypothetical protein LBJ32_04645 [Oscillospiraceae bacterium]|jgi:hypothetical protein|nr:hypothetical protein [Oscillospiraceae bacterium]